MRYVIARFNQKDRDEAYRIYVTKSLQLIPQNQCLKVDYYDIIHKKTETDTRSGDDIVKDIMALAGLRFEE